MEKNSRTEMLPGKRDFYAPPSLRVIRTKIARIARIARAITRKMVPIMGRTSS